MIQIAEDDRQVTVTPRQFDVPAEHGHQARAVHRAGQGIGDGRGCQPVADVLVQALQEARGAEQGPDHLQEQRPAPDLLWRVACRRDHEHVERQQDGCRHGQQPAAPEVPPEKDGVPDQEKVDGAQQRGENPLVDA